MSKPITPTEYAQLKVEEVPVFVYAAINNLLKTSPEVRGKIVIQLETLKEELSKYYINIAGVNIAINTALTQYQKAGWKVTRSVFDWDDPEPEVIYFEAN
jgi:hypothetical protein